jgi:protein SCO1/2
MRVSRFAIRLFVLSIICTLTACQTEKTLPEQRFDLKGKVVVVNKSDGTVTLAHEAIPGYMAAMTMDYPVKDKWVLDVAKPGQTLQATLVVASDRAWLQDVVISETPKGNSDSLVSPVPDPLGQTVPDFTLINQDGKPIHFHQYHGKALLLTFIYTRCPLPDYCPRMSKNFAQILAQISADPKLAPATRLLSISIDPDYDKPAVLRSYALDVAGNPHPFDHWDFASGTSEQVRTVAEFFGLKYWKDSGQIVHALVTALVGPDGKVAKVYRGNDWQPAEVLADLQASGLRKITQ